MLEQLHDTHADDEPVDLDAPLDDPLLARRLLIELAVNERKAGKLKAAMAAILGEYQARIDALAEREARIRESLVIYLERGGECSFPDVGSAYLQHRKASVKVVEPEAFAGWAIKNRLEAHVTVEQAYRFEPGAKAAAAKSLHATGEVPRGCELVPESTSLVVKGVK